MDDTQNLLRRLSRHRAGAPSNPRPPVQLACWKCGHERMAPRPLAPLACGCGGVYAERATPAEEGDD